MTNTEHDAPTEPRIVTPQEAQERILRGAHGGETPLERDYVHTVATEPERTRAAIANVLRTARYLDGMNTAARAALARAAVTIEKGEPL